MLDVIEHLPRHEVVPILSAMFESLRTDGTLIVETGNLASFTGPYLRHIDFTHESGFTENSMRQVLRSVGFQRIELMGPGDVIYSWRSYGLILCRKLWHIVLRSIYRIERGWDSVPNVLTNLLIARAQKPRSDALES